MRFKSRLNNTVNPLAFDFFARKRRRERGVKMEGETDRQTGRQTEQTDRQTERQTDRATETDRES